MYERIGIFLLQHPYQQDFVLTLAHFHLSTVNVLLTLRKIYLIDLFAFLSPTCLTNISFMYNNLVFYNEKKAGHTSIRYHCFDSLWPPFSINYLLLLLKLQLHYPLGMALQ